MNIPERTYSVGPGRRAINFVYTGLTRVGLGASYRHLLTVTGRRTGLARTTPVDVMNLDGTPYLVAPYGEVSWVHNVRAAGVVELRRGPRSRRYLAVQVGPVDAAPVIRTYIARVKVTRNWWSVRGDAPETELRAESLKHPVFRLELVHGDSLTAPTVGRRETDEVSNSGGSAAESPKFRRRQSYRPGRWRRVENMVMSALVGAGLVPHSYLLTTRGRRSGRARRNPVVVVEHDGRHWLVAPYGAVSWVHNARAAGRVRLTRRRDIRTYAVREVAGPVAGPVLQRYVQIASATRPFFQADQHDPVDQFIAEAEQHPVFELIPIDQKSPTFSHPGLDRV